MSHSLSENQNEKKKKKHKKQHIRTTKHCTHKKQIDFFKIRSALKAATILKKSKLMILGRKRSYEQDTPHHTHNHNSLFFPLERKLSTDVSAIKKKKGFLFLHSERICVRPSIQVRRFSFLLVSLQ
jgi:hypothetical protein